METYKNALARSTVLIVETGNRFSEYAILLVIFLLFLCHHMFQPQGGNSMPTDVNGDRGHYVHSLPCPPGFFYHVDHHHHRRSRVCSRCSEPRRDRHERTVRECTPISDTAVGCERGFYLSAGDKGGCSMCSECRRTFQVGRACNGTHDTVCCPVKGMTVILTGSGAEECVFMRVVQVAVGARH
ncbi:hypothetical protein Btru_021046 [Bulinus truncatus]|nr:hypothetical protein Btru_021046 [Bulinus truncatus]